jgi:hypothetical protein
MNRSVLISLFVVVCVFNSSCAKRVSLSIAAPISLAGATVLLDGNAVGRLEAVRADASNTKGIAGKIEGATAMVSVPIGAHELRIVKSGLRPITRSLKYEQRGEDYISVESTEVVEDRVPGS